MHAYYGKRKRQNEEADSNEALFNTFIHLKQAYSARHCLKYIKNKPCRLEKATRQKISSDIAAKEQQTVRKQPKYDPASKLNCSRLAKSWAREAYQYT